MLGERECGAKVELLVTKWDIMKLYIERGIRKKGGREVSWKERRKVEAKTA